MACTPGAQPVGTAVCNAATLCWPRKFAVTAARPRAAPRTAGASCMASAAEHPAVLDLKNRRSVGHKNCAPAPSPKRRHVHCNNWSLANRSEPCRPRPSSSHTRVAHTRPLPASTARGCSRGSHAAADPHFYYLVAAVADAGDWMRRGGHRRLQHACAGLIILLLSPCDRSEWRRRSRPGCGARARRAERAGARGQAFPVGTGGASAGRWCRLVRRESRAPPACTRFAVAAHRVGDGFIIDQFRLKPLTATTPRICNRRGVLL